MSEPRPRSSVRLRLWLWPAAGMLLLASAGLVWAWTADVGQRQERIVRTLLILGSAAIAEMLWFLVWTLFLSRLRWGARAAICAGFGLALLGAGSSVKFQGFSGDVLPRVVWRWTSRPGELPVPVVASSASVTTAVGGGAVAHDYPQFLGPHRDGTVHGVRLARGWSAVPPRPVWRQPIGAGWSGFAIVGRHAVTLEQRGAEELVTCYDLETGDVHWVHADLERFDDPLGGLGPRSTPAIQDGCVYALGATGRLNVLDLETGAVLWSTNIVEDTSGTIPTYGVSASPLVVGENVVVAAGGGGSSLIAYDRRTGERRWSGSGDAEGGFSYSSPVLFELAGVQQLLLFDAGALAARDPHDGSILWQYPWPGETERVSQPVVVSPRHVFLSTGYGVGGKLLGVGPREGGGLDVELLWESRGLKAKFTNVVYRDGFLYGLDDGILTCLDAESGERRWKGGRYGHGQIILVDDLILALAETGEVALVEAEPAGFRELARFGALEGKTWGHPALAGRHLLVRNEREAACYELPLAAS